MSSFDLVISWQYNMNIENLELHHWQEENRSFYYIDVQST